MGNEKSQLPGIEIESEAVAVSNFWSQHSGVIYESNLATNLSIFIEDSSIHNDDSQTPLQRCTKNLMLYRHPSIVKYVGSWQKGSKFYLAVENVMPLHNILKYLNNSQISVGLYSILKALLFLHENSTSHNNICISSIYVSKDGTWKLGGMEYLCKFVDLTSSYLEQSRTNRYNKAVDENESKHVNIGRKDFIDIYAFGVLANEVLKTDDKDDLLSIKSFCDYCKSELQNCDVMKRQNIKVILSHPFFSQDFILIYSFLTEIPVKSDEEKQEFFQNLGERLKTFDENLVASQLGGLLLSRMVLLNPIAKKNFVPYLLTPHDDSQDGPSHSLFSIETFRDYIRPKLIEIFKVHDLQIRLLLLHYLPKFIPVFTKEELQKSILPELLVGIKDTNDELVIATLKALADLVPLLGSELVVGGKRAKLFNDGRPNNSIKIASSKLIPQVKILSSNPVQITVANPVVIETTNLNILAERPRPDGEEGSESQEILQSGEEDLEKWDDWTTSENIEEIRILEENVDILNNEILESSVSTNMNSSSTKQTGNKVIPDITELDIKNQARSKDDDIDFFEDMEPVISNSNKFLIDEQNDIKLEKEINCKLALYASENGEEGWGDNWD